MLHVCMGPRHGSSTSQQPLQVGVAYATQLRAARYGVQVTQVTLAAELHRVVVLEGEVVHAVVEDRGTLTLRGA